MKLLTTSEVAAFFGKAENTIKLWDRKGWLVADRRNEMGHRLYNQKDVEGFKHLLDDGTFCLVWDHGGKMPEIISLTQEKAPDAGEICIHPMLNPNDVEEKIYCHSIGHYRRMRNKKAIPTSAYCRLMGIRTTEGSISKGLGNICIEIMEKTTGNYNSIDRRFIKPSLLGNKDKLVINLFDISHFCRFGVSTLLPKNIYGLEWVNKDDSTYFNFVEYEWFRGDSIEPYKEEK